MSEASARPVVMTLETESDVVVARIETHRLATAEGFTSVESAAIATAISELARNVIVHARRGEVAVSVVAEDGRLGIVAVVRDDGPGLVDTELAMQDGYSTSGTLGLGLPSARRLVDDLHVVSAIGVGTTVTAKKWRSQR